MSVKWVSLMAGKDTVIYRFRACNMPRIRLKCATYWRVAQSIRIHVRHKAGQTVFFRQHLDTSNRQQSNRYKHNGRGNARGTAVNLIAFNPQETMNCE
jgi:hypothetical protein